MSQGQTIQLKSGQLKQCDSNGVNLYPITRVSNVVMEDGRTLLQYLQSLSISGDSSAKVEPHYIDGLVVATVTVNGVPYRIVVPNAGIVTEIIPTEEGSITTEVANYYGLPDFNPADFEFDDESKVRTILNTSYLQPANELMPIGSIEGTDKKKKSNLFNLKTHIEKTIYNGNVNIRISQGWRGNVQLLHAETISISDEEIFNLIKHLIPRLPEYTFLDDGQSIHLLKDNESVSSFEKTTIPTYLLSIDQDGALTLSADGIPLSSVQIPIKRYGIGLQDNEDGTLPSILLSEAGESSVKLPMAEMNRFGLAIYDGDGITGERKPVHIQNGRPYIEPDSIDTTSAVSVEFIRDEYNNVTYYKELEHKLFYPKLVYASINDFSAGGNYSSPVVFTNLGIEGNKIIIRAKATACRGWFDYSFKTNGLTITGTILWSADTPPSEIFGVLCPRHCSVKFFRNDSVSDASIAEITFNADNLQNLCVTKNYCVVYSGASITVGGVSARLSGDHNFEKAQQADLSTGHTEVPQSTIGNDIRKWHHNDVVLENNGLITYSELLEIKMLELEQRVRALEILNK